MARGANRMFEWDEAKRRANLAKHGVDFTLVEAFEFETALVEADERRAYGEDRKTALGFIGPRLYVLVFVTRSGLVRVISLRKANRREMERYAHGL